MHASNNTHKKKRRIQLAKQHGNNVEKITADYIVVFNMECSRDFVELLQWQNYYEFKWPRRMRKENENKMHLNESAPRKRERANENRFSLKFPPEN